MYQRILVPLDGSACSESALPHAQALAEKFGSELILLRVLDPAIAAPVPPPSDAGLWMPGPVIAPEVEESREQAAGTYIQQVAARVRAGGGVVTELEWGGASEQIAHCASEHRADLIVMGTHGRHGIERLLFGSTTDSLLHQTDVPILLIKVPATSS